MTMWLVKSICILIAHRAPSFDPKPDRVIMILIYPEHLYQTLNRVKEYSRSIATGRLMPKHSIYLVNQVLMYMPRDGWDMEASGIGACVEGEQKKLYFPSSYEIISSYM